MNRETYKAGSSECMDFCKRCNKITRHNIFTSFFPLFNRKITCKECSSNKEKL